MNIIFVALGGGLGACCRYVITKVCERIMPLFPYGTLFSNAIAGFLIGFIIGMERQGAQLPARTRLFLTTGLLGGLSTFSAFSMETIILLEKENYFLAGGNVLFNVGLSFLFVAIGLYLAKWLVN